MSQLMRKFQVALIVVALFLLPLNPATAAVPTSESRPSGMAIFGDMVVARPLMLLATAAGTALYVVSLPFTLAGGTTVDTAKQLIGAPASAAFNRCMGCTTAQNSYLQAERNKARAERKKILAERANR